jgi:hypothetical protein
VQGVIRDDSGGPLDEARDPGTGGRLVALTMRWRPPARGPAPARYRVMLLPLGGGNASAVALADVPHAGSRYMLQVSSEKWVERWAGMSLSGVGQGIR